MGKEWGRGRKESVRTAKGQRVSRRDAARERPYRPTAPTNTALIWVKSLRRFAELALRYEESIRRLAREKSDKDKPFPKAEKFNSAINKPSSRDNQWRLQPTLERQPL
eukprot:scaffold5562_cov116-Isochrysis_galbana.AAC.4